MGAFMDLQKTVAEIIMAMGLVDTLPTGETRLHDDLGLDSLRLTELIVGLEINLNIEIDLGLLAIQSLETVDDLCALVRMSEQV
jgi:acyl carrier protein